MTSDQNCLEYTHFVYQCGFSSFSNCESDSIDRERGDGRGEEGKCGSVEREEGQ